jgi:hypothetical protein
MRLNRLNVNQKLVEQIETLKRLIGYSNSGVLLENVEDRYFKDQRLIDFLAHHGIKYQGTPPPSDRGGRAVVYFFGDKVLKLSMDENEAKLAAQLKGDPTVAAIDVTDLGSAYGILMDAVKFDKRHPVVKGLDLMMAYLMDDEGGLDDTPEQIDQEVRQEYGQYIDGKVDIITAAKMLQHIREKTGVTLNDAVPQNVGIRNGQAVITDLGQEY